MWMAGRAGTGALPLRKSSFGRGKPPVVARLMVTMKTWKPESGFGGRYHSMRAVWVSRNWVKSGSWGMTRCVRLKSGSLISISSWVTCYCRVFSWASRWESLVWGGLGVAILLFSFRVSVLVSVTVSVAVGGSLVSSCCWREAIWRRSWLSCCFWAGVLFLG